MSSWLIEIKVDIEVVCCWKKAEKILNKEAYQHVTLTRDGYDDKNLQEHVPLKDDPMRIAQIWASFPYIHIVNPIMPIGSLNWP